MNRFFVKRSQPNQPQPGQSRPVQPDINGGAKVDAKVDAPPAEVDPRVHQNANHSVNPSSSVAEKGNPVVQPANHDPKANSQYALTAENGTPSKLALSASAPNKVAPTDMVAPKNMVTPKAQPESSASNHNKPSVFATAQAPASASVSSGFNSGANNGQALIQLNDVVKAYQTPVGEFVALRGINLSIGRGEFVAVVGKSGSGKSTLINMITGIDRPSSGEIFIDNNPIHNLAEGPMAEWRGRNVGIIFQFFQLLPMLSCIENVMLPMDFCNMFKASEREARALHLLEQVDMVEHAYKLPSEVSGGQQQRVAIARALANDPPLLVADEPTGNLDSRTAEAVFQLFARMVDGGKTILMVTHDDEMAHQVRRTITIADGQIVQQDYFAQQAPPPQPNEAPAGELVAQ